MCVELNKCFLMLGVSQYVVRAERQHFYLAVFLLIIVILCLLLDLTTSDIMFFIAVPIPSKILSCFSYF